MDLDRGTLASLDRRLLAGLDRDERFQMVRVPVAPAKWSTWKRYCASAGISMGRAVAALIDYELARVADSVGGDSSVLTQQRSEELAEREADVASREEAADVVEERLRARSERLRQWETELQTLAQRVPLTSRPAAQPDDSFPKVGRNERCPCRSGIKYKHCHGCHDTTSPAMPHSLREPSATHNQPVSR